MRLGRRGEEIGVGGGDRGRSEVDGIGICEQEVRIGVVRRGGVAGKMYVPALWQLPLSFLGLCYRIKALSVGGN